MTEIISKHETYSFGDFKLDPGERILVRDGRRISLTPRAFDLLKELVLSQGHLLTKAFLMNRVWADAVVEEGNLNRTISAVRKALGEAKNEKRYIETVPKAGYRFVAEVRTINGNGADSLPTLPATTFDRQQKPRSYRWVLFPAAFLLLFGGLTTAYILVPKPKIVVPAAEVSRFVRLTDNQFDEDQAEWTRDGKIRFARFVTSTRAETWVMDADGSNQRRANEEIKNLLSGSWSPDGKRVVFRKDGESVKDVYLANSDGTNEIKLPLAYPPSDWSPDGTRFVYGSSVDKSNMDIFIYEIATGKSTNITNSPAFDADPVFSPEGTQITFVSNRDGNTEAYIINTDGTHLRRLTVHPAVDAFPVLSPDGTQVAFDSNRHGENSDIYLKNVNDDSPPIKLTDLPSNEEHRRNCWSPDGTKMVITSDQGGKNNIYVIGAEPVGPELAFTDPMADLQSPSFSPTGGEMVYQAKHDDKASELRLFDFLTRTEKTIFRSELNSTNLLLSPSFSPDGKRIVFTDRSNDNSEIFVIGTDGSGKANLTNDPAADAYPHFSLDGNEIFFQSSRDGAFERFHIFRMNADGTEQRRITDRGGYEFSPTPFLDGIIFSGDRGDTGSRSLDIMTVRYDGSNERVVAQRRLHDTQPAISPNGRRIAFVSMGDGNSEIYLVNNDGTGLVRLTRNAGEDITPSFSPDGRFLYFTSNRGGKSAIYRMWLN